MNYNIDDILRAYTNKSSYEDMSATTGDYSWVDIVVDAEYTINNAGFTPRQWEIFKMYYVNDCTYLTIASKLSISHQAVADCLNQCKKKINKVLEAMGGDDNE